MFDRLVELSLSFSSSIILLEILPARVHYVVPTMQGEVVWRGGMAILRGYPSHVKV